MKNALLLLILFFSFFYSQTQAQITFKVDRIPLYTPKDADIYLVGSFNNWATNDPNYKLLKENDGTYSITLISPPDSFQYKFTRGNWLSVEGHTNGWTRPNRIFLKRDVKHSIIPIQISSWEDIGTYTFVVKKIPEDTPHDASIYVTGNFNDWNPNHENYKLKKNPDNSYSLTIPCGMDTLEYKFTRGTWGSVEGRTNGQAINNRTFLRTNHQIASIIESEIAGWEDLAYTIFNAYDLSLLLSAFQGILLIIALFSIQHNNREANELLSGIIFMVSIALFSRVSVDYKELFRNYPKLMLLSDIILFAYAPLFYFYIQKLLTIRAKSYFKSWYHFIPFAIHFFAYLPLILLDNDTFRYRNVGKDFTIWFAVAGGIALIYNAIYWYQCKRLIDYYQRQSAETYAFDQNLNYLNKVMTLKAFCLGVWLFTYISPLAGWLINYDTIWITEKSTDLIWVLFAGLIYMMGYFAMNQPEIFRLSQAERVKDDAENSPIFAAPTIVENLANSGSPIIVANQMPVYQDDMLHRQAVTEVQFNQKDQQIFQAQQLENKEHEEQFQKIKARLDQLIEQKKPFTNPKLTIAELADMTNTEMRLLSKVIHESYDKNFHDFINYYRIHEFTKLLTSEKHKNYTFLALAFEVGFNSKTAFNRSFKKIMNKTPREYFNDSRIDE
ncbi:MAG: helix-turn-helix domain-containing protein [Bacteroidetes bacterium]|nr:MAG: helix-turn-helix domain-containing protein [Bacteroidota bacterium]